MLICMCDIGGNFFTWEFLYLVVLMQVHNEKCLSSSPCISGCYFVFHLILHNVMTSIGCGYPLFCSTEEKRRLKKNAVALCSKHLAQKKSNILTSNQTVTYVVNMCVQGEPSGFFFILYRRTHLFYAIRNTALAISNC